MFAYLYSSLKKNLAAGIVVIIPIVFTFWILSVFLKMIDEPLRALFVEPSPDKHGMLPSIARFLHEDVYDLSFLAKPGVGVAIALIVLFVIGFIARTLVGHFFLDIGDRILGRIPIVRTLYTATKQLLSALLGTGESSFREVVLVEYPKKNSYCVGFLASRGKGELSTINGERILNCFVPTTPNPTSGFLLLVPESRVKRLKMSIEDAVKFVISNGIAAPDKNQQVPTTFETPTTIISLEEALGKNNPVVHKVTDAVKKDEANFKTDKSDPDD
jgi:uncharacterized membrane protein